jgi:hypothetical protein
MSSWQNTKSSSSRYTPYGHRGNSAAQSSSEGFIINSWNNFFQHDFTERIRSDIPYRLFGINIYFFSAVSIPNRLKRLLTFDALCYRFTNVCTSSESSIPMSYVYEEIFHQHRETYIFLATCGISDDEDTIALAVGNIEEYPYDPDEANGDKYDRKMTLSTPRGHINIICTSSSGYYYENQFYMLKWRIGYAMSLNMMNQLSILNNRIERFYLQPAAPSLYSVYYKNGWRSSSLEGRVHKQTCPGCKDLSHKSTFEDMGFYKKDLQKAIRTFTLDVHNRIHPNVHILQAADSRQLGCYRVMNFNLWGFQIVDSIKLEIMNYLREKVYIIPTFTFSNIFEELVELSDFDPEIISSADVLEQWRTTFGKFISLWSEIWEDLSNDRQLYLLVFPVLCYIMIAYAKCKSEALGENFSTFFNRDGTLLSLDFIPDLSHDSYTNLYLLSPSENNEIDGMAMRVIISFGCKKISRLWDEITDYLTMTN